MPPPRKPPSPNASRRWPTAKADLKASKAHSPKSSATSNIATPSSADANSNSLAANRCRKTTTHPPRPSRSAITGCFTIRSRRMVRGLKLPLTAMSGNPPRFAVLAGGLIMTGAGSAPTAAGPGFLTSHSAGPATITGAGPCSADEAGSGSPAINGLPRGSAGVKTAAMSDGLRCPRKPSVGAIATGIPRSKPASGSARVGLISSPSVISPARFARIACRFPKTSPAIGKPSISPT